MAKGFLKRVFSFGKGKDEPVEAPDARPVSDAGQPLIDDNTPIHVTEAPDPDAHAEAAANVIVDAEAGAQPGDGPGAAPIPGLDGDPETPEVPAPEPDQVPAEPPQELPEQTPPPATPDPAPTPPTPGPTPGSAPGGSRPDRVSIGATARKQQVAAQEAPKGWLARLRSGLSRSSKALTDNVYGAIAKRKLDDEVLQDLEDVLIQADLGIETAMRITDALSSGRYGRDVGPDEIRDVMAGEIIKVLDPVAGPLELDLSKRPHVILVVGVNGTGKTTTIGKLTAKLRDAGLAVTLGAGDTFRAAAIEQLKIWADRTGAAFVGTKHGADAAGLAYSAYEAAVANGSDVVIIDTAGRLQNKTELMDELAKIVRSLQKLDPDAPHTVLQTLDATTGQNAMNQVDIFRNVAGVNGLVMTKLDGTARGGILVAIAAKFKLPVYFIGVGEGVDDLEPFEARDFAHAIAGGRLEGEGIA